jgi:hypothetical protein
MRNKLKEVKNFYNETIKHWKKKLKKTLDNGTTSHSHGLAKLTLWKWLLYLSKAFCRFNSIPINIPLSFFKEIEKQS